MEARIRPSDFYRELFCLCMSRCMSDAIQPFDAFYIMLCLGRQRFEVFKLEHLKDTAGTIDSVIQCKLCMPGSVGFISKSVLLLEKMSSLGLHFLTMFFDLTTSHREPKVVARWVCTGKEPNIS